MDSDVIRMGPVSRSVLLILNCALAAPFLILAVNMMNAAAIVAVPMGIWILGIAAFNTAHLLGSRIQRVSDGFVVRYLAFEGGAYFRWADIGTLGIVGFGPLRLVVFEGTPARQSRFWALGTLLRRLPSSGDRQLVSLAGLTYGKSSSTLLRTLNAWRYGNHGV